ncbi:SPOR domain-containing protein [Pedobacter gandavensis]|uniref:HU domain-containing protein n=1 Tax=Pedobacter gandavensis TaxID=2679963 RepID=UPI00247A08B2|nr:SPOR domain-containing protein [Pedobacter gandavensis]WGQ08646.1 SPOR domain-containing protein [Pedobacter gandavensis]
MDMLSYLTVLIKTRKEVGIPGLGTIYKKKSPGRYDAATHSFLPPSFVLDFNPEVLEHSLLIDHICKQRNISSDSASYFIEKFVEEIKKQLEEHQEASLTPLGTLYQSSETLSFKPSNDQNFGFDFYGLPPVKEELSIPAVTEVKTEEVTSSTPEVEELQKSEEHQVTEEQLELENSNADLRDESNPAAPPVIEEIKEEKYLGNEEVEDVSYLTSEQDEQPVFEEIAEVEMPKQPLAQPEIESIGNIEEQPKAIFEEPAVTTRPSINDSYAQASKMADAPTVVSSPTPASDQISNNTGFYNSHDEPEERAGIPVYLKILIALLLVLIGLAAGYFIRPDLFEPILKMGKNPIETPVVAQPTVPVTDSLANSDSLQNTLPLNDTLKKDSVVNAKTASTTVTNDAQTAQVNAPAPQTGITFEVIGASVANQKEADRFIAQMKKLGLNAKAIAPIPGKKKIKISIATFNDYNSAEAQIPALQKKLGIKDLYIHTNKPL